MLQKIYVYDARPDTLDFRDWMFQPTLVNVPQEISLDDYIDKGVPHLYQEIGACTGFGLATVCHYLLKTREVLPSDTRVSPLMLYEMAKRCDQWPGEAYNGSTARAAMKGWHKHGVCERDLWDSSTTSDIRLTDKLAEDAAKRPLGTYFRVNHKNLVAMHTALAEVGILYASSVIHSGWHKDKINDNGEIEFGESTLGGHAFAIVAYDEYGFWIQNSWGEDWGKKGFGRIGYADWLKNGMDVWVARLGVPVKPFTKTVTTAPSFSNKQISNYTYRELRPHIITIGNDGLLFPGGTYGTTEGDVQEIFVEDIPRITENWQKKRILLYAHGGLVSASDAANWLETHMNRFLSNEIYPLVFAWKTDLLSGIMYLLEDAIRSTGRVEGFLDDIIDFMLDRADDSLELFLRTIGIGKILWDEAKENAILASQSGPNNQKGGARLVLDYLDTLMNQDPSVEVHVAGYSAGGVFHAPLAQLFATNGTINDGPMTGEQGYGQKISSCTLLAPACTIDSFKKTYLPVIKPNGLLEKFALFTLNDEKEQYDNTGSIYNKSLLYLVSNAFEEPGFRIPIISPDGEPLIGLEKYIEDDQVIKDLFINSQHADWIIAPNSLPIGNPDASHANNHFDFYNDTATLQATIERIIA
ncbi:MAG: C1 family peptidase [Planctomycetes bacterium]|nr:C1 family peptidase [Planctomycetota bacterium]